MKTALQKELARIAPSISIRTLWSHDEDCRDIRKDCDGFDDENPEDWQAWNSNVCATAIADGEEIEGNAYLGGDAGDKWFAGCQDCYCMVGEGYDRDAMPDHTFDTEAEAIAAWNTRAPATPDWTMYSHRGDGIPTQHVDPPVSPRDVAIFEAGARAGSALEIGRTSAGDHPTDLHRGTGRRDMLVSRPRGKPKAKG